MNIGQKIANARHTQGITQLELADKMCVTRQTVSRWEAGTAFPDVEKVASLAKILQVSCDYLLNDDLKDDNGEGVEEGAKVREVKGVKSSVTELLQGLVGKKVKISFYEDEEDFETAGEICLVEGFEENWIKLTILKGKEPKEKLIALSSVLSFEILEDV